MPQPKTQPPQVPGSERGATPPRPEDLGKASQIGRHDPFWLALRWEDYTRQTLGEHRKVTEGGQVKAKFLKSFTRLSTHLADVGEPCDEYYSLLLRRFAPKSNTLRLSTQLLGSDFYNRIVHEQRGSRAAAYDGREDAETKSVGYLPPKASPYSPESLARNVARLTLYRRQYHWFEWGRFWIFFANEFTGAFLYVTAEYRQSGLDAVLHLTPAQRGEWDALEADAQLVHSVTSHCSVFRRRVGSLVCPRTSPIDPSPPPHPTLGMTYEQIVDFLLVPDAPSRRPPPRRGSMP